jgi:hypothetical protein
MKLFGINVDIPLIMLGLIIYLILVMHTLGGCTRIRFIEDLTTTFS